ncbi:MAG: FKBP-type peptidylprolyl isomerase [Sphingomonas sp.]|nr:FKBP-type peptidylprolyl isomerase [Sphingomonas sp.]
MSSVTAVPLQPVKKGYLLWLWLGLIAAALVAVLLAWQGTRGAVAASLSDAQTDRFLAVHGALPGIRTLPSGVQYEVLRDGTGPTPNDGDYTLVSMEGRLRNGQVFQPREASSPMRIGDAIPGFNDVLKLMPKGSRYRFWIPPAQGYGNNPPPMTGITKDSVLVFDVEMLNFISEAELREIQMQQMMQQGGMPPGGGAPGGEGPPEAAPGAPAGQ